MKMVDAMRSYIPGSADYQPFCPTPGEVIDTCRLRLDLGFIHAARRKLQTVVCGAKIVFNIASQQQHANQYTAVVCARYLSSYTNAADL